MYKSRIAGAIFTFGFACLVEILQFYDVALFGRTYDPWDIVMYGMGTGLGIALDLTVVNLLEKQSQKK